MQKKLLVYNELEKKILLKKTLELDFVGIKDQKK